ncbi:fumarylacetoacetase [Microlunatus panaciterrae]|uniref:fumarylacetoacetase n=1 Tax=Microlunatus panaciterrae TaxID=400768 RepID=A0ABS2RLB9_9ACTN|nr:fumarylacetoacetase [Microlunatus panaciterrae]MBM7799800.1 fumarylacetoacetase [Microlunatus panaciterrae]
MSWFSVAPGAPFGTEELPYGIFSLAGGDPRIGVAIGDQVIDLAVVAEAADRSSGHFRQPSLNAFLAAGPEEWGRTRELLQWLLSDESGPDALQPHLHPMAEVRLHLPFQVADYVDFYASEQHATNVGRIFRPDGAALTPNWKHMPIGYHGRSGTVVVTGTDVVRPHGQRKAPEDDAPTFGPSTKLDFEAELGFVVGTPSTLGEPVPVEDFHDHVFGVVILNDWSARDLQAWEYVPLGPFLGKSFATSVSAWVLPLAALGYAEVELPDQDPELLPYLEGRSHGYDITVEVELNGQVISRCPAAGLYYSPAQMLAHLTVNGASLRTGDLYGSGTISGPAPGQCGSLLELTWNGGRPLQLPDGGHTFLSDGDLVVMRASAPGQHGRIRLGEVAGRIVAGTVSGS